MLYSRILLFIHPINTDLHPCISVLTLCFFLCLFSILEVAQEFGSDGPRRPVAGDLQGSSTVHILSQLLRLRQCCCHLSLLKSVSKAPRVGPWRACGQVPSSLPQLGSSLLHEGKWDLGVFFFILAGAVRKRCLFYFILYYLEIIPMVLRKVSVICFVLNKL